MFYSGKKLYALPPSFGFKGPPPLFYCFLKQRKFGPFCEKVLMCDANSRICVDKVCKEGGFCYEWGEQEEGGYFPLVKAPVIVLVKIMLGLPEVEDVSEIIGSYSVCMDPEKRTCMNVIAGREKVEEGTFVLQKFSLYYPDNESAYSMWGKEWPLIEGYSFRTAAFTGSLNRNSLRTLREDKRCEEFGLLIDDESEYEDCAYLSRGEGRRNRIQEMITYLLSSYPPSFFANSYDPREEGIAARQSEWNIVKSLHDA